MVTCKDWLNKKFHDWETSRGRKQSYYAFARFLGVNQTDLTSWMDGSAAPSGTDLVALATHLGQDIYETLALPRPDPQLEKLTAAMPNLPASLRHRLVNAAWETSEYLREHNLTSESLDAKKAAFEIFGQNGIHLTN